MALNRVTRLLSMGRVLSSRCIHNTGTSMNLNKPMPDEMSFNVGYEKIRLEAKKAGEDPFESENRDEPTVFAGSGTKSDPFLVPTRNTKRLVMVELGRDAGPPPCFWVTKENGGRCPMTGRHYKLQIIEGDKWGIDELDLFMH